MKILRLSLNNLASLSGEHHINFEQQPLLYAGLIAITGKTGAGKSTLLDAICLALYDGIPRLPNSQNPRSRNRDNQLLDASGDLIAINDPRNILRRGTVKGYAEVEFIALDGKRYLSRWDVRRSRNKLDGTLKADRSVICIDDNKKVLTSKSTECTPLVEQLIGLNFEQFTRSVLLAQSEVGAFLKAKDQDRADLLEYLTNSNIFSLISQLSFEKTKSFKDELEQLKKLSVHIELLSADQIIDLENQKLDFSQKIATHQQQQKQLEQAQHWFARHKDLQHQLTIKQTELQEYQNRQVMIDAEKMQLKYLEEFAEIRPILLELEKATQQKIQLTQQQQDCQRNFQQTKISYDQLQNQIHSAKQQLKQHQHNLIEIQPALQQALDYDAERLRIGKNYHDKKQQVEDNLSQIKIQQQLVQQLVAQEQQLQNAQQKIVQQLQQSQDIAQFCEEPKASIEKIETFLKYDQQLQQLDHGQFDIEKFAIFEKDLTLKMLQHQKKFGILAEIEQQIVSHQQQLQQLRQQQHAAEVFARSLKNCINISEQYQLIDVQIKAQKNRLDELLQQKNTIEQQDQLAEQHLQDVQKILEQQRLLQSQHIQNLRASLQHDQPCVVCGSQQHPYIEHSEILANALSQIQNEQEQQAIQQQQQIRQKFENIKQQFVACQTQLQHDQQRFEELTEQLLVANQQLVTDLSSTGFDLDLTQSLDQIQQQFLLIEQAFTQKFNQKNQEIEYWQHAVLISKDLQQQQQRQAKMSEMLQQRQQAQQLILVELHENWHSDWQQQPVQTAQRLKQNIIQLTELQKSLRQQQQQIDQLNLQLKPMQEKLGWFTDQQTALAQQLENISVQGKNNTEALVQHLTQHGQSTMKSGKEWQQQLSSQGQVLQTECEELQQQLIAIESTYHQRQTELAQLNSQLQIWKQQLLDAEQDKQKWLEQHAHFDAELQQQCLKAKTQDIQQYRDKIQQFEQQYTAIHSAVELYRQELEKHAQSQPMIQFEALQQQLIELEQLVQDFATQRDAINAQLIHHAEREKQQQQFQKKIDGLQQQINRWGKISELIGSKEGTKFQRIAQEHHLDILVEYANQQLQPLAPRYQLQRIQNSLGLAIIDHDMNAEPRSVLSLSGGETFLVSLALALAIANMASGHMKLESLFIDEGFGTLDPASLHIVMDALDRLQSQGRKIILISHVQEMHERIPVQIQVTPQNAGASVIEIVG